MNEALFFWLAQIASWVLILAGSGLILIAALGLVRMPDLYTRMHAAGITDSCGSTALLLGLAIQAGFSLVAFKLLILVALLFFCSPVSTHALARAALHAGILPLLTADRSKRPPERAVEPERKVARRLTHAAE